MSAPIVCPPDALDALREAVKYRLYTDESQLSAVDRAALTFIHTVDAATRRGHA